MSNLARFAAYAGLRHDLLANSPSVYTIENAPDGFDGRIEAIRVVEYGRFGNLLYQTLHAIALARQLNCHTVVVFPFHGAPAEPAIEVGGLRIVLRAEAGMDRLPVPTLAGHFFAIGPFESALGAISPALAWGIVQHCLRPLFHAVSGCADPPGDRTLVMSFRSGDIFTGEPVHPLYVQPPTSYYMQAVEFACAELGVTDVRLVFEDRGNPAIACVEAQLGALGIPCALQSASFIEDLSCLANASHLVAPFSTFAEAAALLSGRLRSYFGFRAFESHQQFHRRQEPLLLGVLRLKGVRAVLIDDALRAYTPPRTWKRSASQLQMIRDYPMDHLIVLEGDDADRREAEEAAAAAREQAAARQQEAMRLRTLLLASRDALDAAQQRQRVIRQELEAVAALLDASRRQTADALGLAADTQRRLDDLDHAMHASTSWRVTAPLRWLARTLRRMRGGSG
jgi:hypothetical protein